MQLKNWLREFIGRKSDAGHSLVEEKLPRRRRNSAQWGERLETRLVLSATIEGTPSRDSLVGTSAAETIVGGDGDDTLVGRGGADAIEGGNGNDKIEIPNVLFSEIHGGPGFDTVTLNFINGKGKTLDLTTLDDNRMTSIELINITGTGSFHNTLKLNASEVLNISESKTLRVKADETDVVEIGSGWTHSGYRYIEDRAYDLFIQGDASLLVENHEIKLGAQGRLETTIMGGAEVTVEVRAFQSAGDVNGDGYEDQLVVVRRSSQQDNLEGPTYVVFGASHRSLALSLEALETAGIQINGHVTAAGDVNGDGFDDLLLRPFQTPSDNRLILGRADLRTAIATHDTSLMSTSIPSPPPGENGDIFFNFNAPISGVGDINGDGFDDFIVENVGLIFGGVQLPSTITPNDVGAHGIQFLHSNWNALQNIKVAGVGDVNADGFDDLLFGSPFGETSLGTPLLGGRAFVVFGGQELPSILDLADLPSKANVSIVGTNPLDYGGVAVSRAGDVNGDGFDDFLIGSGTYDNLSSTAERSRAYLIYGSNDLPAQMQFENLGANGVTFTSLGNSEYSGHHLAAAGDVNGDGFDDFMIGSELLSGSDPQLGGFLFFGSASLPQTIKLQDRRNPSLEFTGISQSDHSGLAVVGMGDIDGDDFDDFAIVSGRRSLAPNSVSVKRDGFLIYGHDISDATTQPASGQRDVLNGTEQADVIHAGAGDDEVDLRRGADVLLAGPGDDVIFVTDLAFRRINGGRGSDSLTFRGEGLSLDLRTIPASQLTNIERIDITSVPQASTSNSLTLDLRAARDVLGSSRTLRIDRDVLRDVVTLAGDWTQQGHRIVGSHNYDAFTQAGTTVLIRTTDIAASVDVQLVDGTIEITSTRDADADIRIGYIEDENAYGVNSFSNGIVANSWSFATAIVTNGIRAELGGGNDRLSVTAKLPVIAFGGAGNDTLQGGGANDTLIGEGGEDSLDGRAGNDRLIGSFMLQPFQLMPQLPIDATPDGPNTLHGGTGADTLEGGDFGNELFGEQGNDWLAGGTGADLMLGGQGNDFLFGGDSDDTLYGGAGRDFVVGDHGNDQLFGEGGVDTLGGRHGADTLDGGAMPTSIEDFFRGESRLTDRSFETQEGDRVSVDAFESVYLYATDECRLDSSGLTHGRLFVEGSWGNDTLIGSASIESIFYGFEGDDLLQGGNRNDLLLGGNGNDTILGLGGNDTISGDVGDDLLDAGAGTNLLREVSDGNLRLRTNRETGITTLTGLGRDTLLGSISNAEFTGGSSANRFDATKFAGSVTLRGEGGPDFLIGSDNDDLLDGGLGSDTLQGDSGNDLLFGGAGNDELRGGFGNDSLTGYSGDDALSGGFGIDIVTEDADTDFTVIGTGLTSTRRGTDFTDGIERLELTGGPRANKLDARRSAMPVVLSGGDGDDTLLGSNFDDTLRGGNGNDILSGGAGRDALLGQSGDDTHYEVIDADVTVIGSKATATALGRDRAVSLEAVIVIGGNSANRIDASAATVPVSLLGGGGNDTLIGGPLADVLIGGKRTSPNTDSDSLDGGLGNDRFDNDANDIRVTDGNDEVLSNLFSLLPVWLDAI